MVNKLTMLHAESQSYIKHKGVFVTEYLDQSIVIGTYRLKNYSASKCETSDVISDVINV